MKVPLIVFLAGCIRRLSVGAFPVPAGPSAAKKARGQVPAWTTTREPRARRIDAALSASERDSHREGKEVSSSTVLTGRGSAPGGPLRLRQRASRSWWPSALATAAACLALAAGALSAAPRPSLASDYGSLSDEQKVVAEAWRLVDNSFLDRTFNRQDWFELRKKYVLGRKYRTPSEAQAAIAEMVGTLGDKYTRYLPPAKYQSLVDAATGTLAGVGVELSPGPGGGVVASDVEDGSPARGAGIQPGDAFVEVDGAAFPPGDPGTTPDDVALRLRGPEGSRVGVVVERGGKKLDFILTRRPITITSVKSYVGGTVPGAGKVGVIRIKSFSGTTAATVAEKLKDLKAKGCASFVIDCRGNPGGLLPGGVDTASLFLDANEPVVFVVNKKGVEDSQATLGPGIDLESPVVVLVDSGTASAAEVFTAALQENGRAVVAGQRTFGKGIVQTIRSLSDGNGGVSVTVARYETPQHHDINRQGIPVTVEAPVDCPKDDALACLNPSAFQRPPVKP
jgi:carboxyl-terminal processing protease